MSEQPTARTRVAGDGDAEQSAPVVRDRRRIDPTTGQVRQPAAPAAPAPDLSGPGSTPVPPGPDGSGEDLTSAEAVVLEDEAGIADVTDELSAALTVAEERLGDLQRLQAEYVNYRRRVDRDRDVARDAGVTSVLEALLPVLDDVQLARQHGDLTGPFAAIVDKLETALGRLGLERYGAAGEEFDPAVHEALMHATADDATTTTVSAVLQPGYVVGGRVLRPARVGVTSPA